MADSRVPRASALMLCLCSYLSLFSVTHQITITQFTVPSGAEANENVSLSCQYVLDEDDPKGIVILKWWWTPLDAESDEKSLIYQHISGQTPLTSLHSDQIAISDNDTIVLLKVDPADSGTYECEVDDINEIREHQELIVYTPGSGPELNLSAIASEADNDAEDGVLVTCAATDASPEPQLALTVAGKVVEVVEHIEIQDGLYNISANFTTSIAEAQEADVRCELTFRNYNFSHPKYMVETIYNPKGDDASATVADAGVVTATNAPHKSLQNIPDSASQQDIFSLLFAFALAIHLLIIIY